MSHRKKEKKTRLQQEGAVRRKAERLGIASIVSGGCAARIEGESGIVIFFPKGNGPFKEEVYEPLNALGVVQHSGGSFGEISLPIRGGQRFNGVILDPTKEEVLDLFRVDADRFADAVKKGKLDKVGFPSIGAEPVGREEAARLLQRHFSQQRTHTL